jgi:hypothetical protein
LLNISLFDVTDNSQAPILAYSTTYQSSPTGTNQKVISNFDFAVLAGRSYIVKICDPNVPNPQNQTPPLCGSSSIFLVDYPNYPINLTARALSGTQIRLTWEDGAGTETGARIERSLDGVTFTSAGQVGANVTTFTNSSLTANRLYFYRVIYFDADGDMFEGDVVMARTAGYALSASSINSTGSGFVEFNYVGVDRRNSEIVAAGTFEVVRHLQVSGAANFWRVTAQPGRLFG